MSQTNSRRKFVGRLLGVSGALTALPAVHAQTGAAAPSGHVVSVRDHGAAGDGARLDTQAMQRAIDACVGAGGGTVFFPAGRYLSGTLFLKSRVTLQLDAGAVLLGSKNLQDYPVTRPAIRSYTDNYTERSLIYGEDLEQVCLQGQGIIDGQGSAFKGPYKVRPYLIRIVSCRDVQVRGLIIKDSPMWVQHYLACDGLWIDGLSVHSHCNYNNDGIDIDGCQDVRIANCQVSSQDDAIVLKSTLNRACKNVVITNCVLSSDCNAFKMGTESNGGFENVALSNCVMRDTRLAGLALELVDGGRLDHVNISNITMQNVQAPIFIRLGNRARPFEEGKGKPGMGRLSNVMIRDVQATGAGPLGCSITGLPDYPVENVSLGNVRITFVGGGKEGEAQRTVPEHPEKYPEHSMFGVLPAYGFYCRHVKGLRLHHINLDFQAPDMRPSLVCDDVDDLELFAWNAAMASALNPAVWFKDVRRALVHGCRSPENVAAFLQVEGNQSAKIRLLANDIAGAKAAFRLGAEASPKAVTVSP
jgi:hypothetical protein